MLIAICAVVPFTSKIFAYTRQSYLDIREGYDLETSPEEFYEGNYQISFYPQSYKWYGHCELITDLYKKDLIGKTFLNGLTTNMTELNTTYMVNFGYYQAYKAFFYFLAQNGGMYADPVYIYNLK